MSRGSKILVGILSFLPIILLAIFLVLFIRIFPNILEWEAYEPTPQEVFSVFAPVFLVAIIMSILSLGLLVFFIVHLVRNKHLDTTERVIWILAFLFAGIVGYPLYWFMRIWNDEPRSL